VQRLQREGRVAHPRVPVVPVPLATWCLRQRGRERRDGRARRHVRQSLDCERGALDRMTPAVIRDPGPPEPGSPEASRGVDSTLRLVDVLWGGEVLGPREGTERAIAGLEHVPGSNPVPLDSECEIRLETNRLPRGGRVGCVTPTVDERPGRRHAPVLERGLADELQLDPPLKALDRAHEHVVGVVVGRRTRVRRDRVLAVHRPHRQRVADDKPARRRLPRRHEDVRSRLVDPGRRMVDPERGEPERAGLAIEDASKDARRVEARHTEPVDCTIRGDKRTRVTVREERVIRDRRKRRGHGRALRTRFLRVPRCAQLPIQAARVSQKPHTSRTS
jgi:hypothetical protein